jgi:alpha-L-fucosidase
MIYLLVDIVSKNGNLLLDVGPEADGTIPDVQMNRLKALGAWLQVNGDAIYATHPWKRAAGETAEGIPARFTQKDSATYAILLGQPKTATATFKSLSVKPGTKIFLLGNAEPLAWSQQGDSLRVDLPAALTGHYAYSFRIDGPVS